MSTHIIECARVEALFVSAVQPSDAVTPDQVRMAVTGAVRRHGTRGCAALVAFEFGEHPETAVARMRWAVETVAAAYPARRRIARPATAPAPVTTRPRPVRRPVLEAA
jgi:hypothetical protein